MFGRRDTLAMGLGLLTAVATATAAWAEDVARVEPVRAIEPRETLPNEKAPVVTGVALGSSGGQLATAGDDHLVRIWNLRDGSVRQRLTGHADWVRAARFGPDGKLLATAGDDRRIRIWQLDGVADGLYRSPLLSIASPEQAIHALAFHPNGQLLAAAGFGGRILLIDTEDGETLDVLDAPGTDVRALVFSPDGSQLAAAGREGTIRVWNTADRRRLADLAGPARRVRALAYVSVPAPSGQATIRLASGGDDRRVHLWDVAAGTSEALPERPAKIVAMGYCPPGRLAVGGSDNLIRVWDLAMRRELCVLGGHTGTVAELVWNPTDGTLVSGSFDTTVRQWRLPEPPADRISRSAASGPMTRMGSTPAE